MLFQALSIVAPNGTKILHQEKVLEVRSWIPNQLPIRNLVIVENKNFLNENFLEDEGMAIALVDIESIHTWQEKELELACASYWETGYFAWVISNVRPIDPPIQTIAKRKIFNINLAI